MSALATDPVVWCEAVTTHSRERPAVPALKKTQILGKNSAPLSAAITDLSPADNVNIKMHARANGLNTSIAAAGWTLFIQSPLYKSVFF